MFLIPSRSLAVHLLLKKLEKERLLLQGLKCDAAPASLLPGCGVNLGKLQSLKEAAQFLCNSDY